MKALISFIMSLLGACALIATGMVIGFWIEVLTYAPLTNCFYECKGC